jgi:cytochrome P450
MELFSESGRKDPYPIYEHFRKADPVHYAQAVDFWMVFEYTDVKRVLTDHEYFASHLSTPSIQSPAWLVFTDPPKHSKLRSLISQAFTPKAISQLEPKIQAAAEELLASCAESDEIEFVSEFAGPLPIHVISDLVGIPKADRAKCKQWSDALMGLSRTLQGGEAASLAIREYQQIHHEMSEYLRYLSNSARDSNSLIARLVNAQIDGQRLTEAEILGFFQLLLSAGHESTTNLIGNAILTLTENQEQLSLLRSMPDLLPSAIEEVIRYRSPVQAMYRMTTREVNLSDIHIPEGSIVLPVIGSANRDPKVFLKPDRFEITRNPNPHLGFGHGIHFCLGSNLARLEAKIALSVFLSRYREFDLANQSDWEPHLAMHVYGPRELKLRLKR